MISAVVIALNEEEKIAACITSLSSACDECIVIDTGSTDQTVTIAKKLGAKVYSKKWSGYGSARNYGATIATHTWILSIDADERLDKKLSSALQSLDKNEDTIYKCNRLTQYCGQWIKYGAWHPEWKEKLYHKLYYEWDDKPVHERLRPLQKSMQASKLLGLLLHEAYATHEELESKLDAYALLAKENGGHKNCITLTIKRGVSPKYHFLKSYIWRRGFMDGHAGYKIAKALENYHRQKV